MTKPTQFPTKQAAAEAGYIPASGSRFVEEYRGFEIAIGDVSGGNSFGYDYAVVIKIPRWMTDPDAKVPADICNSHELFEAIHGAKFGASKTISLTGEKNKIGGKGCYTAMFDEDEYRAAVEQARKHIDKALAKVQQ